MLFFAMLSGAISGNYIVDLAENGMSEEAGQVGAFDITDEMAWAGDAALEYVRDAYGPMQIAKAVYSAMEFARSVPKESAWRLAVGLPVP